MGVILHFLHRCSNHHGHHMDQKSKERKEQGIRASRYHIYHRYFSRPREFASSIHYDRRIFRMVLRWRNVWPAFIYQIDQWHMKK